MQNYLDGLGRRYPDHVIVRWEWKIHQGSGRVTILVELAKDD